MALFRSLIIIELVRLKTFLVLATLALILFSLWLGMDLTSANNFNFHYESSSSSNLGLSDMQALMSTESLLSASKVLIPTALILSFFSLLVMVAPFRSRSEWQDGQFQLIKSSCHSLYRIQLIRYGFYLCFLIGFATLTLLLNGIAIQQDHSIQIPFLIQDFTLIAASALLTTVPLAIAIGMLIDSCRTAYYLRGQNFLLSFIQFAGWLSLMKLSQNWIRELQLSFLPSIDLQLASQLPRSGYQGPTQVYLEPMFMSAILALILVAFSSRILEEAEA